jgi:hypothetical protein
MMLVDAPGLTCSRVCSLDGGAAVRHFWSVWIWIFTYSKPDSVKRRSGIRGGPYGPRYLKAFGFGSDVGSDVHG